jgi:radical SAM protein (TIGR01212 family)
MSDKTVDKRPYLSLNRFLKERFGERVQKIPLDAGLGCPHRRADGTGGCIFCDSRGAGTGAVSATGRDIREQMKAGMKWGVRRYKAHKFMAYFQSWTNTFASPARLRQIYADALIDDSVVGIAIGTRPDCIDRERLDIIAEVAGNRMVWIEYGLQSASDKSLQWLGRGHTVEDFLNALSLAREYGFLVCAHIMFGIPDETGTEMKKTVSLLKECKIDGVKFHQLYVVKNTVLHRIYNEGRFVPISMNEYADIVAEAIVTLDKQTVIHRLAGDPPLGELVAPEWAMHKRTVVAEIHRRLGFDDRTTH